MHLFGSYTFIRRKFWNVTGRVHFGIPLGVLYSNTYCWRLCLMEKVLNGLRTWRPFVLIECLYQCVLLRRLIGMGVSLHHAYNSKFHISRNDTYVINWTCSVTQNTSAVRTKYFDVLVKTFSLWTVFCTFLILCVFHVSCSFCGRHRRLLNFHVPSVVYGS